MTDLRFWPQCLKSGIRLPRNPYDLPSDNIVDALRQSNLLHVTRESFGGSVEEELRFSLSAASRGAGEGRKGGGAPWSSARRGDIGVCMSLATTEKYGGVGEKR